MSEFTGVDSLSAGDILLYRTNSLFGRAILRLDETEVSHAALFLGDEVAEALTREGLVQRSIQKSIEGCPWVAVMRVQPQPGSMTPVWDVAQKYLDQGNRYGYEQILLLAVICLTRRHDLGNPLLRRMAIAAMGKAVDLIDYLFAEGKEPMICSEFVFRTYDEARPEPDDPYSLEIISQATGEPRRWFSRPRRLLCGETPPKVPSIHPDSLLAQLQAADETPEALLASANKMANRHGFWGG